MKKALWQIIALFCIELVVLLPVYMVNALTISNIKVGVSGDGAQINWTTNDYSTSFVNYGNDTNLGLTVFMNAFVKEHSLNINSLESMKQYFFEVMSQNLSGYSATDNNGGNYYTFTTLDIIPPDKVDGVEASGITMNSLTLKWNQSGESDFGKYIIYRNLANIANTTTTSYFDGNLSADTQYTYRVSAVDNMGNEGSESSPLTIRTVAPDLTKPSLTSVAVVELADTSAKISWVTNENATSSVYFGNSSDLGNEQVSSSLITNHTISISNLIKNVEYYYLVGSCDASNNCDNSSQQSFIAGTDTTLPTIDVSIPSHFNSRRMDIGGKTEPRSTVRVYIDNNLERQLSSNYIGDSGEFFFYDVYVGEDETTHTIKIWARDFIGNIYEREFEVLIDLNYPVLTINPIPETISEESITISGTVNEQSTIKFYTAYGANDLNPPLKIAGLANESVSTNSVKIKWNESTDSDFYQYIIYREDVGAIATTSSAGYTTYTDVLVNTNTSYTYSVSALDASGNEGFKSEALTVKTLEGGRTNITPPDVVNITNVFSPVVINSSGEFSESIELDQGDGVYQIVIEAVDVAGNDVKIYNQTLVDTRPPEIANITPKTGSYIYEIYADEVDIEGDVEPDVTVKLYLNKSNVDLEDYSTITDMFGHFKFDDIDLTKAIGVDFEPREVSPSDFDNQYFRARSDEPYWPVRLDFVATDKLGKQGNATVRYQIRTCWSGNFTYDTVPLTEYQSPTFLSTERLAEGSEAIYFFLNFSYHGIGTNDAIESISISKACDYYIANDPQYNYSCRIMPSSCTYKSTEDNKALYVTCPLGSIDEMNKWLEDDWKGFFDAINNEMIFPFSIKIRYKHDVEGKTVRGDQRMCEEIVYDVDASKINFKDVLPDWLLYNLVDWLDSSIESLEKVMESVKDVLKIVGIGCVGSIVIKFILTFSRRFTCYYDGFQDRFSEDADKRCPIREEERNKLSNSELKEKCESCYNAWETEEKFYMIYRGLCDRVFCHTAPAAWTADVSSPELREKKILESRQCGADDQAQQGQPLIEVKCSGFDKGDINMDAVNADNKCYRATVAKGTNNKDTKSLVFVKSKDQKTADTANNVYKFTTVSATSTTVGFVDNIFTRKYSDKYYTARSENCKEYCARYDGWGCGPAQSCIDINFDEKKAAGTTIPINRQDAWTNLDPKPLKSNKLLSYDGVDVNGKDVTYSATRAGLTADCIFGNEGDNAMTKTPLITTDDMKIAEECCCISESGEVDSGKYYSAADTSKQGKPAFEADEITEADYPKFSYRYYKIKFETSTGSNQYDPDRYVEGRDKPGCFGQQKVWFMPDKLQHDPFTNHISTFQCGCISGIYHRLEVIRNLMTYMSNCLITVRETGTADSGACKELFSQYVCSLFWRLIVFFREGCLPWGQGIDLKMSENRAAALFGGGVDALWGGVAETQAELTEEYGNAQLTNFLGIGEEALAKKVCMAAFGYDWGFDLDNIIDAAYATPYATLVLPVNPTREYLTFDPTNGYATYEYRAAWLIIPGCDMDDYDVQLACVTRNEMDKYPGIDCTVQNDPMGSNCDCINLDHEKPYYFYDGARLKQSELEDKDKHDVISSPYRYDHYKFTLRTDRDVVGELKSRCFPEDNPDGVFYFPITDKTAHNIAACRAVASSGTITCPGGDMFYGSKGSGYFVDIKINGQDYEEAPQAYVGEDLIITPTIWKAEGADLCLHVQVAGQSGLQDSYSAVDVPGTHEYPPIMVVPGSDLKIGGGRSIKSEGAENVAISVISTTNTNPVDFSVEFRESDSDTDDYFTISSTSVDEANINGNGFKPISTLLKDGRLIVEKDGAKISIDSVSLRYVTNQGQKIYPSGTITVQSPTTSGLREDKTISLELLHLKDENQSFSGPDECNAGDKVVYQGTTQQRRITIQVYAQRQGENQGCIGEGYVDQTKRCICGDATQINCGGDHTSGRYCYANAGETNKVCHTQPQCKQDGTETSKYPCDCDSDGDVDGVNKDPPTDCSGNDNYKYCYDGDDSDTSPECHNKPKPTSTGGGEFKIKDIEIDGNKIDISKTYDVAGGKEIEIAVLTVDTKWEEFENVNYFVKNIFLGTDYYTPEKLTQDGWKSTMKYTPPIEEKEKSLSVTILTKEGASEREKKDFNIKVT